MTELRAAGGFVTTEWMVGVALLILPVAMVVAVLPAFAARHEAVAAAAREGARAAAQAGDGTAAAAAANQAVAGVLTTRGLAARLAEVQTSLPPLGPGGALPRSGDVGVTVRLPMPEVAVPIIGPVTGPTVVGEHRRALDPYRTR